MRKHHFKAWDKTNKQMWPCLDENGRATMGTEKVYLENDMEVCCPPDWVLLWYTGLFDKNGVEICDGDIVKCTQVKWEHEPPNITHEVTYCPEHMAFAFKRGIAYVFNVVTHKECQNEVIGNIYENPELIMREDTRTYILAATHAHAYALAENLNLKKRDFVVVTEPRHLHGCRPERIIETPDFCTNPKMQDIIQEVKILKPGYRYLEGGWETIHELETVIS